MGHRASYAIIEDGRVELFFSRWGGKTIVADLLVGPDAATAMIRPPVPRTPPPDDDLPARLLWNGPDPVTELLDDVFCEGAALIDHDRRVVLAYQWMEDYPEFAAAIAGLGAAWPGWQVRWAFDGIGDLAAYLGQDRLTVRSKYEKDAYDLGPFYGPARRGEFPREVDEEWDFLHCVLSVRHEDGSMDLYASGLSIDDMALPTPAAFDGWPSGYPTLHCAEIPRCGIHVDFRSRSAGVWTIDALKGYLDDAEKKWPGWRWTLWGGDIHRQVAACDGRLTVPDLPDPV